MKNHLASLAVMAVLLAGCATEQGQRTATGAAVGAGVGALAGQAIGRDTNSTLVGAGAGALIGGLVGAGTTPQRGERDCRYRRNDGSVYIAPCPRDYRG